MIIFIQIHSESKFYIHWVLLILLVNIVKSIDCVSIAGRHTNLFQILIFFLFFFAFVELNELIPQLISLLFFISSMFFLLISIFMINVSQMFAVPLCIFSFLLEDFLLIFLNFFNRRYYFLFKFVSGLSICCFLFSKQFLLICWSFDGEINMFMRFCIIYIFTFGLLMDVHGLGHGFGQFVVKFKV